MQPFQAFSVSESPEDYSDIPAPDSVYTDVVHQPWVEREGDGKRVYVPTSKYSGDDSVPRENLKPEHRGPLHPNVTNRVNDWRGQYEHSGIDPNRVLSTDPTFGNRTADRDGSQLQGGIRRQRMNFRDANGIWRILLCEGEPPVPRTGVPGQGVRRQIVQDTQEDTGGTAHTEWQVDQAVGGTGRRMSSYDQLTAEERDIV